MWPARSIRSNENVTLHFKIEREGSKDLSAHIIVDDKFSLDPNVEFIQQSFSPPTMTFGMSSSYRSINVYRYYSEDEANLKMMPGFRLSWYYTGMDFMSDPLLDFQNKRIDNRFN